MADSQRPSHLVVLNSLDPEWCTSPPGHRGNLSVSTPDEHTVAVTSSVAGPKVPVMLTMPPASMLNSQLAKQLFTEPNAPMVHLSRPGDRMHLTAPTGEISYERLTPGRGDLEVLRAELQPGDVSAPATRGHESTECVVVLDGSVVAEVGQDRHVLTTGEALTFDSRLPHRYCNETDAPAAMLLAITPPVP